MLVTLACALSSPSSAMSAAAAARFLAATTAATAAAATTASTATANSGPLCLTLKAPGQPDAPLGIFPADDVRLQLRLLPRSAALVLLAAC